MRLVKVFDNPLKEQFEKKKKEKDLLDEPTEYHKEKEEKSNKQKNQEEIKDKSDKDKQEVKEQVPVVDKKKLDSVINTRISYERFINVLNDFYNKNRNKHIPTTLGSGFLSFFEPFDKEKAMETMRTVVPFKYNNYVIKALLSLMTLKTDEKEKKPISRAVSNIITNIGKFIKSKYPTVLKMKKVDRLMNVASYYTVRSMNAVVFVILLNFYFILSGSYSPYTVYTGTFINMKKSGKIGSDIESILEKYDTKDDDVVYQFMLDRNATIADTHNGHIGYFSDYIKTYVVRDDTNSRFKCIVLSLDYGNIDWNEVKNMSYDNFIFNAMKIFNEASLKIDKELESLAKTHIEYYSMKGIDYLDIFKHLSNIDYYSFRVPDYEEEVSGYLETVSEHYDVYMEFVVDLLEYYLSKLKKDKLFTPSEYIKVYMDGYKNLGELKNSLKDKVLYLVSSR